MYMIKNHTKELILVLTVLVIIFGTLIFSKDYFNWNEIETLTSNADKQGLSYELIIHNNLTGTYTFNIINE